MQPTPTPDPQEPQLPTESLAQPLPVPPKTNIRKARAVDRELDIEPAASEMYPEMRPHAFVIMPFGKKTGADGSQYDFNAIYSLLIKPALEAAGFESFRADESTESGDILTDMFQELLLADLCIADMSIDNANVFYELGIRHAFRKRGVVHIQAGRPYMPFDVFNVRTIPYHITPEGVPDANFLEKDRATITRVARDTRASDMDAVHSPIFNLLDGLVEPDRKTLKTPLATGFWREYDEWKDRLTVAERQKRIGDILLLTEEIRNPLIKEDAIAEAGEALKDMGHHELALTQYRKGLEVNARNRLFRREEAFSLNRLGKVNEAITKIESLLEEVPGDTETVALLGRIYKEMWLESWNWISEKDLRLRTAFDSYHWLLKSFQTYLRGYRLDLDEFYPGINAYTLGRLLVHLADQFEDKSQPDPEIQAVRDLLPELSGSLAFSLETKTQAEQPHYWAVISLGELLVSTADAPYQISRVYRKALTASGRSQFSLKSSLSQLEMLLSLDLRPEFVQVGIEVISDELRRMRKGKAGAETKPQKAKNAPNSAAEQKEGMVFLFTGCMAHHEKKKGKISPAEKEEEIRASIDAVLRKYDAGPDCLAVTTGMDAGSELIFVEECVARGVPVQAYFPLLEGPYVRDFVTAGGEEWTERFYKMRNDPLVSEFYQPDCVGLPRESDNVHERNNRWALYSALARGIDRVRLIALWDGRRDVSRDLDARLYKHMIGLMRDMGGVVEHIKPVKPDHLNTAAPPATVAAPADPLQEKISSNGHASRKLAARKKK